MKGKGRNMIQGLKAHVLQTMDGIDECNPDGQGVRYRVIQDLAGLELELPAHDGWLTWSILASLVQDGKADALRKGRRLYWRLARVQEEGK